ILGASARQASQISCTKSVMTTPPYPPPNIRPPIEPGPHLIQSDKTRQGAQGALLYLTLNAATCKPAAAPDRLLDLNRHRFGDLLLPDLGALLVGIGAFGVHGDRDRHILHLKLVNGLHSQL